GRPINTRLVVAAALGHVAGLTADVFRIPLVNLPLKRQSSGTPNTSSPLNDYHT
ncbi:MAG: hypothetical protein ACI9YR_002334, partial [Bacteroidia bacterium]